jgi:hypothetical protein
MRVAPQKPDGSVAGIDMGIDDLSAHGLGDARMQDAAAK